MTKEEKEDVVDLCNRLESLFNEKITELNKVVGGISARHAYYYYRELIWQLKDNLGGKCG